MNLHKATAALCRSILLMVITWASALSYAANEGVNKQGAGASACPCESVNYCRGPRGGKYCVTKTGYKKYFKPQQKAKKSR